jgi:hypothetical protein
LHVLAAHQRRHLWSQHIGAARAADEIPIGDQGLHHDRERKRRDREEHTAQPQSEIAGAEAYQCCDRPADHDHNRQRHRGDQLVERHRRIGADREEGRDAEIHVAGVAAQDVPRRAQHDVLHDHVAQEEGIAVADRTAGAEHQERDRDQRQDEGNGAEGLLRRVSGQGCHWASPPE